MKKRTKRVVIAAVVLIVIGLGLVIAGMTAVGGMTAIKSLGNEEKIIQNLLHDTVMESVVTEMEKVEEGTAKTVMTTCVAEKVDCLVLDLETVAVDVKESSTEEVFRIETSEFYEVYEENGTLYVVPKNQEQIQLKHHEITMTIPEDFKFETVKILADASELEIQKIRTKELNAVVNTGNVVIEELLAEKAEIEISTGSMEVERGKITSLETDVDTGNFTYTGKIEKEAEAECELGNMEFSLEDEVSAYDYVIECNGGNVMVGDHEYTKLLEETKLDHHAGKQFRIECDLGRITVQ